VSDEDHGEQEAAAAAARSRRRRLSHGRERHETSILLTFSSLECWTMVNGTQQTASVGGSTATLYTTVALRSGEILFFLFLTLLQFLGSVGMELQFLGSDGSRANS